VAGDGAVLDEPVVTPGAVFDAVVLLMSVIPQITIPTASTSAMLRQDCADAGCS
jgi:hypothetical protein